MSAINLTLGGKLASERTADSSRVSDRKMVVGFEEQPETSTAEFGWAIHPQEPIGTTGQYRQLPSQTSLTALVSLPAWWDEIRLLITRRWSDPSGNGEGQQTGPALEYTVELPVNFETVDASLFDTNDRGPVVLEWETERLNVRVCERAEIIIPGVRLWRSTVVTLGSQKANQIFVLPDMNGIIATFDRVEMPSSWTKNSEDYQVPLTVWTSQGKTSLPIPVTFPKSDKLLQACPPPPTQASAQKPATVPASP